jgi:hypothetical protein
MSVDARAAYFMTNRSRYQAGYSRVFVISTTYAVTARSLANAGNTLGEKLISLFPLANS